MVMILYYICFQIEKGSRSKKAKLGKRRIVVDWFTNFESESIVYE